MMARYLRVLLILTLGPASASGEPSSDPDTLNGNSGSTGDAALKIVKDRDDAHASERLTQPGSDPWLVSSSVSLFTRPSIVEGFKFSNDTTTDKKSTYGVSTGWTSLLKPQSPFLDGLQLSAAYNVTDKIGTVGLKWNVDFKDVRFLSRSDIDEIAKKPAADYETCVGAPPDTTRVKDCFKKQAAAEDKAYKDATKWRPTFALALGSGWNFDGKDRDKSTATAAFDLAATVDKNTVAVTANAEITNSPPGEMATSYDTKAGGGLQLSETYSGIGKPVTILTGAKLLGCLSSTCGDDSSVEIVVGGGVQIQKATQVGITVKWAGKASSLGEAIGGISFSYTWVPPSSKK